MPYSLCCLSQSLWINALISLHVKRSNITYGWPNFTYFPQHCRDRKCINFVKLSMEFATRSQLSVSHQWSRWKFGALRQLPITWTNVERNPGFPYLTIAISFYQFINLFIYLLIYLSIVCFCLFICLFIICLYICLSLIYLSIYLLSIYLFIHSYFMYLIFIYLFILHSSSYYYFFNYYYYCHYCSCSCYHCHYYHYQYFVIIIIAIIIIVIVTVIVIIVIIIIIIIIIIIVITIILGLRGCGGITVGRLLQMNVYTPSYLALIFWLNIVSKLADCHVIGIFAAETGRRLHDLQRSYASDLDLLNIYQERHGL